MESQRGIRRAQIRAIARAGLWAVIGLFGSQLIGLFIFIAVEPLLGTLAPTLQNAALTLSSGIGLVIVAAIYLQLYDLDIGYIDVRVPSLRDLAYVVAGVVLLIGSLLAISVLFTRLGIQGAQHGIIQQASENNNPELLLAFVPLSIFVVGPTEELVFRNVVQKSLYARFDKRQAVVIASVLFAVVHFPAYLTSTLMAAVSSVFVVLILSLVLGEWYRRTGNLTVAILVHGIFNAIQFALSYGQLRYDLGEAMALVLF